MPEFTLKAIKDFFGYEKLSDFSADWKEVPVKDRDEIKAGLSDGSLTY